MKALVWGLGALVVLAAAVPSGAEAQRGQTRERIEALEKQIEELQTAVYGEGGQGAPVRFEGANPNASRMTASSAADTSISPELSLRISGLEREVERLTGQIEQLSFQLRQQNSRMDRLVQLVYPDYEEQVSLGLAQQREVLGDAGVARTQPSGGAAAASGPVDLVGGSGDVALGGYADAAAAYNAGRSALYAGRFDEAERAFLALTENYPGSEQYADGLYFLGETYLAQEQLRASAEAYLDFIRNYGDNPRAPRAHLKLGEAFAKADRQKEACRVWLRGVQTYPDMDSELALQIQEQQIANSCPGFKAPDEDR